MLPHNSAEEALRGSFLLLFHIFFPLFTSFFAEKQLNVIEELCDECKTEHTREIESGVQQQRNWTLFAVTSDIV